MAQAVPGRVRAARWLLVLIAVGHGGAVLAILMLQPKLAPEMRVAQPGLGADDLATLLLVESARAISFHALLVVICGIYAAKIASGSRPVFRIVVASVVVGA